MTRPGPSPASAYRASAIPPASPSLAANPPASTHNSPSHAASGAAEIVTAQGLADAYRRKGLFDALRRQLLKDFQSAEDMKGSFEDRLEGIVRDKLAYDARRRMAGRDGRDRDRDRYGKDSRGGPAQGSPTATAGVAAKEQHAEVLKELDRHTLYDRTVSAIEDRLLDTLAVEDALTDILDASRPPEKRRKLASNSTTSVGNEEPTAKFQSRTEQNGLPAPAANPAADADTSMADITVEVPKSPPRIAESDDHAAVANAETEARPAEIAENPSTMREASPGPPQTASEPVGTSVFANVDAALQNAIAEPTDVVNGVVEVSEPDIAIAAGPAEPVTSVSDSSAPVDTVAGDVIVNAPLSGPVDATEPSSEGLPDASSAASGVSIGSAEPSPATTASLLPGLEDGPSMGEAKPMRRTRSIRKSVASLSSASVEIAGGLQSERRLTRSGLPPPPAGQADEKGRVTRSGASRG